MAQGDEIHIGSGTDLFLRGENGYLSLQRYPKKPKIVPEAASLVLKYAQ